MNKSNARHELSLPCRRNSLVDDITMYERGDAHHDESPRRERTELPDEDENLVRVANDRLPRRWQFEALVDMMQHSNNHDSYLSTRGARSWSSSSSSLSHHDDGRLVHYKKNTTILEAIIDEVLMICEEEDSASDAGVSGDRGRTNNLDNATRHDPEQH